MANRFPLVFDAGTAKSIQELPTGDNLNLTGSSIFNAVNISASGTLTVPTIDITNLNVNGSAIGAVAISNNYNDLSNLPTLFSGNYNDLTNAPAAGAVSYNDLTNKPVIATQLSQLTNDINFVTNAQINITASQVTDLTSLATSASFTDLINVPNFVTNEQIVGGSLTVEVTNTGDLTGSVFSQDSTIIVDHQNNELRAFKLYTDVIESDTFDLVAQDRIALQTPNFLTIQTQSFEIFNDNSGTNISDQDVIRFNGNINFSGATVTGLSITLGDNLTADIKGSIFGDDSTVIVDSINRAINSDSITTNFIDATSLNGNLERTSGLLTISSTAGIQMLPAGPLNIPTATSVNLAASEGIAITATNNLTLNSTSGVVNFGSGATIDFANAAVTNLNVTFLQADMQGSVFGDDSALLVDGVNEKIVGDINSTEALVDTGVYTMSVDSTGAKLQEGGNAGLVITTTEGVALGGARPVVISTTSEAITIGNGTSGNVILGHGSNTVQIANGGTLDLSDLTAINFQNSTIQNLDGSDIAYTPADNTDWDGTPPDNVQDAIDRLVAWITDFKNNDSTDPNRPAP